MFIIIKNIHLFSITVSILLFSLRGILMIFSVKINSTLMYRHKAFKILPAVIDTILLISGFSLMVLSKQYPWHTPWLAAKLIGLVIYIILGILALNRIDNLKVQIPLFISAIMVVSWMLSVALSKNPLGFLLF